ncbi:MAG: OmpA family protein, partial [Saprospiraceae bacterium]
VLAENIGPNEAVALVENLGDRVNTPGDEFAPLPSVNFADRIYYAAARPGCVGGRRNDAGYEDETAGHWCSDMFSANLESSGWQFNADLGGLLNTSRFEVPLGFDDAGQILYFFRGFTLYAGDVLSDTANRKNDYAVTPPAFRSTVQPENGDAAPFFFNDTTVIFASRQPGGYGGLDLYFTTRRDSVWTLPRNLGPTVNSAYDETTPFLARDARTLFFSSNRLESMGGLDVYKTYFDEKKNTWDLPQNLGNGVNSPGDDAYFRLDNAGRQAFLSSDRLNDNYGERDLYLVYFKEQQPEQNPAGPVVLFSELRKASGAAATVEVKPVPLEPLFYTTDRDVLQSDNQKIVDRAAAVARQYPSAKVLITAFTDVTGPAKFDLYAGIKRAELVGKALTDRGIPAGQILLRSVGSDFALARNVLDAAPNPSGQKLNRRLEITLVSATDDTPTPVRLERPAVSEIMATPGTATLDQFSKGLAYKVEVATTRQILSNDALSMFSELMIESQPGAGSYRYTAGFLKQFDQAVKLRKELGQQGFEDAFVVAYVNGVRVSKADAVSMVKKYPDLAGYVK